MAAPVCALFRWRLVAGKSFDIRKALKQANDHVADAAPSTEVPARVSVETKDLAEKQNPVWTQSLGFEDHVQSADRDDDTIIREIECRLRIGLSGGASGFELKSSALPGDAFELALFVQNYHASVADDLEVSFQLPDRVEYVPGQALIVTKKNGKDSTDSIPETQIKRLDQIVSFRIPPRGHLASDSIYLHIVCRIARPELFPFGSTDLACRAIATIGDSYQASNLVIAACRRPRSLERVGVLGLFAWNERAPSFSWIHRSELIAVKGEEQCLKVTLINQGTANIDSSYVDVTCSHKIDFEGTAEQYQAEAEMQIVACETSEDRLRLHVHSVASGTPNTQHFLLRATLRSVGPVVTLRATWIAEDEVLANDYIELRLHRNDEEP
ncbi:MAG: hypothetical protein ACOYON_05045 [Fimbriimonas sp.]